MKPIFADTSFYAACLMPRDAHHVKAVGLSESNRSTILTTEFIIVELANFFSKTMGRAIVTDFIKFLRDDPDTIIVPATSELVQYGFELFLRRHDKEWSLTDCISFVVMEEYGVDGSAHVRWRFCPGWLQETVELKNSAASGLE